MTDRYTLLYKKKNDNDKKKLQNSCQEIKNKNYVQKKKRIRNLYIYRTVGGGGLRITARAIKILWGFPGISFQMGVRGLISV